MLRAPDGRLVILDFGLMTRITDDQKFGMIEAIAHLIHRDYTKIGDDFVALGFIPKGTDTRPIVPALARVFEAALAGGGAKSINFQELAADLAEITFAYPFRIPPYFALIIRAISVLEGIALVGNPEFAIVDEAYPFIARRLLTDRSPRAREAFRYMLYGRGEALDVTRVIDMLQAFEKFMSVKDNGDGTAFKQGGRRGGIYVGRAGDAKGTKQLLSDEEEMTLDKVRTSAARSSNSAGMIMDAELASATAFSSSALANSNANSNNRGNNGVRQALKFFFSEEGDLLREFLLDEISNGLDALSRDALRDLLLRLGLLSSTAGVIRQELPGAGLAQWWLTALSPELTPQDRQRVDGLMRLVTFFAGDSSSSSSLLFDSSSDKGSNQQPAAATASTRRMANQMLLSVQDPQRRETINAWLPTLNEFAPKMREFGGLVLRRMLYKGSSRLLSASLDAIFGPEETQQQQQPVQAQARLQVR